MKVPIAVAAPVGAATALRGGDDETVVRPWRDDPRRVSVPATAGCKEIADLMVRHGISAVPVVDARRHVLGVVSEADLLAKLEYADLVPRHPLAARRQWYAPHTSSTAPVDSAEVPPWRVGAGMAELVARAR